MSNIHKTVPLKVFGRSHYACKRCKLLKTKCSGELPCSNCKAVNKADACVYPTKDRKIVIMQSDLDILNAKVEELEKRVASGSSISSAPPLLQTGTSSQHASVISGPGNHNLHLPLQIPLRQQPVFQQNNIYNSPQPEIFPLPDQMFHKTTQFPPPPQITSGQFQPFPPPQSTGPGFYSTYATPYSGNGQNGKSQSTSSLSNSPDIVQERILGDKFNAFSGEMGLENFLLPDFVTDLIQGKMYDLAYHKLPEKSHALTLIHKVNNTYNGEFYILDMEAIIPIVDDVYEKFERRNGFSEIIRKTNHGHLCYLFSTLAFGEQLLNSHVVLNSKMKIPGIEYYLLASQLLHLNREELDLCFIQTALTLGLYSVNLNRYNTVYNFFGVAVRSTLAKGLHRKIESESDLRNSRLSPEEMFQKKKLLEKMKRVFWSVYVIDTTWSTHRMSLPVHINYVDTDVDLPMDDPLDLHDNFDVKFLELNVHLSKYIAKSIKLIHGANMRTLSISYVNTTQFNQKQQAKNCLSCLRELVASFEEPCLGEFDRARLFTGERRSLTNLFLRFHQLMIIITRPLLFLIFNQDAPRLENPDEIHQAILRGIEVAHTQIDILLSFYTNKQLFILGFWDSQHLFSAIMVAIIGGLIGRRYPRLALGVALLKHMADHNNINALNCIKRLAHVNEFLVQTPEIGFTLNLRQSIEGLDLLHSRIGDIAKQKVGNWNDGINNYSAHSKDVLFNMINSIQSWDVYADKNE